VLAERGAEAPVGKGTARATGVHVDVESETSAARPASKLGQPLVTARCLERPGFVAPPGARLTPLAQEEQWRRRDTRGGGEGKGTLRVAVGADHGGFALKQAVLVWLRELGHVAVDLGT